MKIRLLTDKRSTNNRLPGYIRGEVVTVVPALNGPDDSPVKFWVAQDGWQDDAYGMPVYENEYKVWSKP